LRDAAFHVNARRLFPSAALVLDLAITAPSG
jgi:hypothetical protein